jgi:pyruvate dehydrogenase E2 component (dihydrolipoamide acetyltransferase)
MAVSIVIPRLGWNMEEGIFHGWLKQEGEAVRAGEAIFRLESDKATEDVESLDSGVLRIGPDAPKEGDKVPVGLVIGHLEGSQISDCRLQIEKPVVAPVVQDVASRATASSNLQSAIPNLKSAISPRARRVATELGIDWKKLQGSGRTGRIREKDVRRAALTQQPPMPQKTIPLSSIRRAGAERLEASRRSTVPVTLTTTANVTNLLALRRQFQTTTTADCIVPSLTDFFVKLTALALERHPLLTARWSEDQLVMAAAINIGIAVDTGAGLLVPVLEEVPSLHLRQLAARSRELIERARQGKLAAKEMQGGVFTVTNLGMYGIDAFTPIINHPECAILGIGRIRRVPVFVDDDIVGQGQVTLSLTFDHRFVDGVPAAKFLQTLVQALDNPGPWLMP